MSSIDEKVLVQTPLGSAKRFLERWVTDHAAPNGEGARIALRAGDLFEAMRSEIEGYFAEEERVKRA
jgi:hypothetical protein